MGRRRRDDGPWRWRRPHRLHRAITQGVHPPHLEDVFPAVRQFAHRRGPRCRSDSHPVAELRRAALPPAVFVADDRSAAGVCRGIPSQRHLAVAGARRLTKRRDRRRHPRRRYTDIQRCGLVRFVPCGRRRAARRHGERQRVVVVHLGGPRAQGRGVDPVVGRLQRPDIRLAEHGVVLLVRADRILTGLDVVPGEAPHSLGEAEPHRERTLHRRRKVGRHLNRQGRDGHPLPRLRPVAGPLVVGGPHLHFIDRARLQVRKRQAEPRPLVLPVDEAPRALFPVLHVVVGDGRPRVRRRRPAHPQAGGRLLGKGWRFGHFRPLRLVVLHRHRHRGRRHRAVVGARHRVRHRRRVVRRVGVVRGPHRHRLRRIPVRGREGQRLRHRHVVVVRDRRRHRHVARRLRRQLHRVGPAATLVHHERRGRNPDSRRAGGPVRRTYAEFIGGEDLRVGLVPHPDGRFAGPAGHETDRLMDGAAPIHDAVIHVSTRLFSVQSIGVVREPGAVFRTEAAHAEVVIQILEDVGPGAEHNRLSDLPLETRGVRVQPRGHPRRRRRRRGLARLQVTGHCEPRLRERQLHPAAGHRGVEPEKRRVQREVGVDVLGAALPDLHRDGLPARVHLHSDVLARVLAFAMDGPREGLVPFGQIGAEDQGGVTGRVEVVQGDGGGDRRVQRHPVARREHDGN